ncbi:MAG: system Fe-S assembly protein NifU family [Gammaproteobacteria bacterium]|jgi:nitrogen fixation NifU-like protein|nr:system Fe-S assembly protein NifU family [Gammaproteobacteria bacterium]
MSELRELYQEIIIDHGRHPRNFGFLPEATCHQEGFNPLCGDKIILHLYENKDVVEDLKFEGSGCAISIASASLMTECLKGKSRNEIEEIFNLFHKWVTMNDVPDEFKEKLGKLEVLGGVREFPARVKCATLAWHTLKAALLGQNLKLEVVE